ncbi:TPA: CatB-related O-acetyltransferase [Citrobacter sedlakii]
MKRKIKYLLRKLRALSYFKYNINKVVYGVDCYFGRGVNLSKGIKLGDYCYIGQYSYIGPNTIIGNFAIFADNVNFIGSDHRYDLPATPVILSGVPDNQPQTVIGDDVWLGHGVTIMRGIKIGNGAIVAANSVVTKNIPAYEVWAGIPARKIKERFNEENILKHENFLESYSKGLIKIKNDREK